MSSKKPLLRISGLSVIYPGSDEFAIENVSFEIFPRTINMLIGPNGSGKSTVLKAIIGSVGYQGEIKFEEEIGVNDSGGKGDLIAHTTLMGYVPQRLEYDLTIPITVNDFLSLALLKCVHDGNSKEEFIRDSLGKVQAIDLRHRLLGSLSGGQRQRVVLARALIHHPRLLILDEPEAGVDVSGEHLIYRLLQDLVDNHDIAALIATHELEIVNEFADQVLCINKKLLCHGLPQETLTTDTFKMLYGARQKHYHHQH